VWEGAYTPGQNFSSIEPKKVQDGLEWPNNITPLSSLGYTFGDGFLVPGKSNGGVYFVFGGNNSMVRLTAPAKGQFYHKGYFFDVDGDGALDIITARASKSLFGKGKGQLVWLKNAGFNNVPWVETVLADGPDVDIFVLPGNGTSATIFAAEFFGEKVSQFDLENGKIVSNRTIDDTLGEAYCVRAGDIEGNGEISVIASNYKYSGDGGSVFLYSG
jgi:hypothetical protein